MLKILRHAASITIVSLLLTGLLACEPVTFQKGLTQISDLEPDEIKDNEIYLKGEVTQLAKFLDGGAYEIQDKTGNIWVITENALPEEGEQVLIRAQVKYESIPVGQLELGEAYVVEIEQVERSKV